MLVSPPRKTAAKARKRAERVRFELSDESAARKNAATPDIPQPTNQAIDETRPARIPIMRAAPGSSADARMAMPKEVFVKNHATAPIATSATAAARILFQLSATPSTCTDPETSGGNGLARAPQMTKIAAWISRPKPIVT